MYQKIDQIFSYLENYENRPYDDTYKDYGNGKISKELLNTVKELVVRLCFYTDDSSLESYPTGDGGFSICFYLQNESSIGFYVKPNGEAYIEESKKDIFKKDLPKKYNVYNIKDTFLIEKKIRPKLNPKDIIYVDNLIEGSRKQCNMFESYLTTLSIKNPKNILQDVFNYDQEIMESFSFSEKPVLIPNQTKFAASYLPVIGFTPPLKYLLITIDNTVLDKFECELQEDVNCHYSIKIKNYNEIFIDQHNNTLASLYEELCTKNTPQVYECKN